MNTTTATESCTIPVGTPVVALVHTEHNGTVRVTGTVAEVFAGRTRSRNVYKVVSDFTGRWVRASENDVIARRVD